MRGVLEGVVQEITHDLIEADPIDRHLPTTRSLTHNGDLIVQSPLAGLTGWHRAGQDHGLRIWFSTRRRRVMAEEAAPTTGSERGLERDRVRADCGYLIRQTGLARPTEVGGEHGGLWSSCLWIVHRT